MRALILTCNTGEGHNSVAASLKEEFDRRGIDCDISDSLGFISKRLSRFVENFHTRVYRYVPRAFRNGYSYSEKHEIIFSEQALVYKYLASGADALYDKVIGEGYTLLICAHVFSALMVTEMRRRYDLNTTACFVATDYTCSPCVAESDLDVYFMPHDALRKEFEENGIPKYKLIPSGIPVCRAFREPLTKEEAKKRLGIAPELRNVLLMCGSMGCGPVKELAEELVERLPDDCSLTVVCGTNERLLKDLSSIRSRNLHVLGYVDYLPLLLSASELFLTKPGGLSISEAAAKRTPMLFIDVVGGCERRNLEFFVANGWGETRATSKALAEACVGMLEDPAALARKSELLKEGFQKDAAEQICDIVSRLAGDYETRLSETGNIRTVRRTREDRSFYV